MSNRSFREDYRLTGRPRRVLAAMPGPPRRPDAHGVQSSGVPLAARSRRERTRRLGAVAVAVLAVVSLLSALTPPLRGRLHPLLEVLPLAVPLGAQTVLVPVSVALLLLARGLRRGQRLAWALTLGMLAVSAVLHLFKGVDVEEALLSVVVGAWLATRVRSFPVVPTPAVTRRALTVLVGGGLATLLVSAVLVVVVGAERHPGATVEAVVGHLVGLSPEPLTGPHPHRGGPVPWLSPALLALGVSTIAALLWTLLGPRAPRALTTDERRADRERARAVVAEFGGDTLDYFALRDDKDFFFAEGGVVAHSVRGGVCLVSPDPICAPADRRALLTGFLAHAERNGWSVAVVGAGTDWLPLYEATGLRPVYLGDEAVVDCRTFSLTGSRMKSLRGAVNRVAKAGVTVTFHDPATLDPAEQAALLALAGESRQGETERGYSMTLSRIFDPADTGLLLSVARDADDRPVGFIQWTPAAAVDGYSLDVMRRSLAPDVPNGLTDALIVATIAHLAAQGRQGLALNFAVLREVVAGERTGTVADLGRAALQKLSQSAQIESLWRFNAKYDPAWRSRYVVLDALDSAAAQSLAIAGAEGVTEVPVLGRLFAHRP